MFGFAKPVLLAAFVAVSVPTLAAAASVVIQDQISVGVDYSFAEVISPGDTIEFRFTPLTGLKINSFSVSGTGTNAEDDVRDIRFGLSNPPAEIFSSVDSVGETAAGFGFIDGGIWNKGSVFSIFFSDGIDNDVGLTLSFETSPIPLPAAGLLLGPVVLAAGAAALRRRKAHRVG
jgi:hypothetical protein